jgi:uncharacterized membrane protein
MENAVAKIERIINEGYDFKFGEYISRGFSIVQKNWGGFIGFTILFLILVMVIGLIPIIGYVANTFFITPALTVGFYLVANKLWTGQNTEFGDFFKGFDNIGQLALTALVQNLIILATLIPFVLAIKDSGLLEWYMEMLSDPIGMQGTQPPVPPSWAFILLLPTLYLAISYSWSYKFVVFNKMQFWDAMESSRKLITKKWPIFFIFYIVIALIAGLGVIVLCVGILFTLPAYMCMMYAAFEDVTQLNADTEENDNIDQHLIV